MQELGHRAQTECRSLLFALCSSLEMEDLSCHILDIAENSLRAGADEISIEISDAEGSLNIEISDNGRGMDAEILSQIVDPFFTTKTVRKVGLGISFFKESAEMTGGDLKIESKENMGTKISATFKSDHIDCKPLGDIMATISTLVLANPAVRFRFLQNLDDEIIEFDTQELLKQEVF